MIDFKVCYPDANNFNQVLKLKSLDEWNCKYTKLDDDLGFWTCDTPFRDDGFEIFKNLIASFPIQKDNNHPSNFDPNPFDTIHVPEWVSQDVCLLLKDFYLKNIRSDIYDPQIHEWGNVYFKKNSKPITCWRIPHIDYPFGIVANMWFTDHPIKDSGTKIYRYHGKMYKELYDFQIDENHPNHKRWRAISEFPKRASTWFNIDEAELASWGFELAGIAPTAYNTMTMYRSNVCHLAYITDQIDFRWSHTFAFSHELPPMTLGDIFK
jgi:hypothetical protein